MLKRTGSRALWCAIVIVQFRTWAKPVLVEKATRLSRHSKEYKEMRTIVDDALAGESLDPTRGAQYYYYSMCLPSSFHPLQLLIQRYP